MGKTDEAGRTRQAPHATTSRTAVWTPIAVAVLALALAAILATRWASGHRGPTCVDLEIEVAGAVPGDPCRIVEERRVVVADCRVTAPDLAVATVCTSPPVNPVKPRLYVETGGRRREPRRVRIIGGPSRGESLSP